MSSNIKAFTLGMTQYATQTVPGIVRQRMTAIAFEALRTLIELTPVDTGRAKGNWQITLERPAEGELDRRDQTPQGISSANPALGDVSGVMANWEIWQFIWIHNGVPYIGFLNDGTEKMPAVHMLERTSEYIKRWLGLPAGVATGFVSGPQRRDPVTGRFVSTRGGRGRRRRHR